MTRFIPTGRSNPCPVCGTEKNKCRTIPDSPVILCMETLDQHSAPSGWRFLGMSKNGTWGKLLPTDAERESTEQRQQRIQERRSIEAAQAANALPPSQRDKAYRRILAQLDLHPADLADLEKRGFTPQQIKDSGVKSAERWQPIKGEFPVNLPGLSIDGHSLVASAPGQLWPVRDVDGLIVGLQLRIRGRVEDGRYRWLSSRSKRRPDGAGPNLANGELPLPVFRAGGADIALVEGTGAKPVLTNQRLGVTVVGAAGAQWAYNPQELKRTLADLQPETITLYPDAGCIHDAHTMRRYEALQERLRSLGYRLQVAWWGQEAKGQPDIDELDNLQRIRVMPWEQFLRVGKDQTQWALNRIIRLLRPAKGVKPKKRPKAGFQAEEPAPAPRVTCTALARLEDLAVPSMLVKPDTIPPFESWKRMGRPELLFHRGQRRAIWDRLIVLGYPVVLDEGPTGDGKTREASEYLHDWRGYRTQAQWELAGYSPEDILQFATSEDALPPELLENRAYYYSAHYRKPSNTLLESIPEAVTGGGLVLDHDDPLPSGAPSRRRPRRNEKPDIEALCVEDNNIQLLRGKGIDIHRGKGSPFCENCPLFQDCGYLKAKEAQQVEPALRSHLSQGGKGVVAFIDEASRSIETEADITVTEQALTSELGRLNLDSTTRGPIAQVASILVQGIIYAIAERGHWGMAHDQVLKFLPTAEELQRGIDETEEGLRQSIPLDADLWDLPPATVDRELSRVSSHDLDGLFSGFDALGTRNQLSPEAKGQLIDEVMQAGAIRRIVQAILTGKEALTITPGGQLRIKRSTPHQRKVLRGFNTVVLLDATPDRQELAAQLRIPARDMVTIKPVETGDYRNLTFTIWDGIGQASAQREDGGEHSMQQRLELFAAHLAANAADPERVGLLDNKAFIEGGHYSSIASAFGAVLGYNHRDQQNTNKFEDCTTLIAINPKPKVNVNEAKAIWQVRHGSTGGAFNWIERQAQTHLIQEGGRPRAQHRDEGITINLVGSEITTSDVFALQHQYPGCTIQRRHVFEVCPEAAPRGFVTRRRMLDAISECIREGGSASLNQVSKELGVTKGRVSQIACEVGGWACLVSLLEALYRETKHPGNYSDEVAAQLDWVNQFLPDLVERYRNGELSEAATVAAVEECLEMVAGWGLWLSDKAHDALNELFIAMSPDWAIPLMAPPIPTQEELILENP